MTLFFFFQVIIMERRNLPKTLSVLTLAVQTLAATVPVIVLVAVAQSLIVMWISPVLIPVLKGNGAEIAPMSKQWQPSIRNKKITKSLLLKLTPRMTSIIMVGKILPSLTCSAICLGVILELRWPILGFFNYWGKSLIESWRTTFIPDWQPPLIFAWFTLKSHKI